MSASDADIESAIRESFARQKLMVMIGASMGRVARGEVEITLAHRDDLTQQNGFLHAAVLTAILDSAAGYAALSMMPSGSDVLSVEFKVNLLAPAMGDRYISRARVKRSGRTLTVCEADCFSLRDGTETLVATLLGTMIRGARGEHQNGL